MKRNTGIRIYIYIGTILKWMLDFRPYSAENEYGSVVGTVWVILKRQEYQCLKKYFFPSRSVVGIKLENVQIYIYIYIYIYIPKCRRREEVEM